MAKNTAPKSIDYETYREIMDELLLPIDGHGLDVGTMERLCESKLVYLENLRVRCFLEMNQKTQETFFTMDDYRLILAATKGTVAQLHDLVILAVSSGLSRRLVS